MSALLITFATLCLRVHLPCKLLSSLGQQLTLHEHIHPTQIVYLQDVQKYMQR